MDDQEDINCELSGDERALADLEAGIPAYGKRYSSGSHSQLQRAIWGDNEDALLYDTLAAKRRREAQCEKLGYITGDQFFELYDAVCFANSRNWVMNVTVDIQPGYLGIVGEGEIFRAFRVWLARYRDWCSQRRIESVYIYVWERPRDKGLHVHMLCHIPDGLQTEFKSWACLSVQSLSKPGAYAAHLTPEVRRRKQATAENQWRPFKYRMKGLSPEVYLPGTGVMKTLVDQTGIDAKPQGEITGKRVGSSRSISWKARKAAQIDGTFTPLACDGDTPASMFWTDAYLKGRQAPAKRLF
ncbi:MAG: hypothetical protein LCH86_23200 [Proteobacteria bacterium]|nr:hypothetical protein [Pseudomonadota bacterium]